MVSFLSISTGKSWRFLLVVTVAISGCDDFEMPKFGKKPSDETTVSDNSSVRLVERDVEAPDVFQVTESALWDGRPSLGGVWVAYPGQVEPERVIIRNEENDKFVIGALFKRERENPGPRIQLSSDAAAALGILAGQPTKLNVTALRREEVPDEVEVTPVEQTEISEQPLDPVAVATAAIDKAEAKKTPASADTAPAERPVVTSSLAKPFIQIGIFSIEANATKTAANLRNAGIIPVVKAQESRGKKFWRVLAGPADSETQRASLLTKAKAIGFSDAYYVTN